MKRRYRSATPRRRRKSLKASNWGPILALTGVVLAVLAFIALLLFVVLPKVLPLLGIDYKAPFSPTPTPVPTIMPTPMPRPIETADSAELQNEVVFPSNQSYRWVGDPYFYDGTLIFTAGKLVDTQVRMSEMFYYDPQSRTMTGAGESLENDDYLFPVFNEKWLVYLDANAEGGGLITAISRTSDDAKGIVVKEVYTGQPRIQLDGDYIAWTERTGTKMDKLYVCDLDTLESTTVQMFSNSVYGQSLPSLQNGMLVWADAASDNSLSEICSIKLSQSTISNFKPGTYVHDPEINGRCVAWLDGHHGPETKLYYSIANSTPVQIDTNVVEFGVGSDFIAYGKDEHIYVYLYAKNKICQLTPDGESAQFLGVSDDKVLWMDVTSRERDILKFAPID